MAVHDTWHISALKTVRKKPASVNALESKAKKSSRPIRATSDPALKAPYDPTEDGRRGENRASPPNLIVMSRLDNDGLKPVGSPEKSARKELKRTRRKVAQQRDELYGRRLHLKEKRNELRQERELLVQIDSRYTDMVRRFQQYPNEKFDESIFDELSTQRDVVGSLQYEYDQAEDEHDAHENQFEKKEEKLVALLSRFSLSDGSEESNDESASDSSLDGRRAFDETGHLDSNDETKIRLMEYESRIGDARIMQERLQDLMFEQGRRLSFAKKREKFGLKHEVSDVSTENLESRFAEVTKELDVINGDVQQLKEALQVEGYSFDEVWAASEEEKSAPAPSPRSPSIPVQRPQAQTSISDGFIPQILKNVTVLHDRINRWIFATFGDSPVEHVRHKVILRDYCSLDDDTWAHVVPEFWSDEAIPEDGGAEASKLRSGASKAKEVMKAFERKFPATGAPKDRATPYEWVLESDLLSQYESRST